MCVCVWLCGCVCQRKDNCRILMNVFEKVVIFCLFLSLSLSVVLGKLFTPRLSLTWLLFCSLLYLPVASRIKLHHDVLEIKSRRFVIPNDRIVVLKAISDVQRQSLFGFWVVFSERSCPCCC